MSRNITILALIQLTLVTLGFFALGIVLKIAGYPMDPPFMASLGRVVWSPIALLLRNYGLGLLFVSAVWGVFALFCVITDWFCCSFLLSGLRLLHCLKVGRLFSHFPLG